MLNASLLLRRAVLCLVLALLVTSGAWAVRPDARASINAADPASGNLLGRAWNLLVVIWAKVGCNIDPNGRCKTSQVSGDGLKPPVDTGCNIDPNGRCHL
jgi:hypothetical protein